MHVVWQPFRAMPLAQDMFCTLDAVLCWHLSTYSNQIIQKLFSFVQSIRNYTFGVTICDACAANHIVKKPHLLPPFLQAESDKKLEVERPGNEQFVLFICVEKL